MLHNRHRNQVLILYNCMYMQLHVHVLTNELSLTVSVYTYLHRQLGIESVQRHRTHSWNTSALCSHTWDKWIDLQEYTNRPLNHWADLEALTIWPGRPWHIHKRHSTSHRCRPASSTALQGTRRSPATTPGVLYHRDTRAYGSIRAR